MEQATDSKMMSRTPRRTGSIVNTTSVGSIYAYKLNTWDLKDFCFPFSFTSTKSKRL
jgi:hypothetical protein